MNFAKRLRFYLIGVSLGVVLVLFFFGPRSMKCSYFPNARALDEAKLYPMTYEGDTQEFMKKEGIDSVYLYNEIFKKSKIINFGSEEVRTTPCRTYRAQFRDQKDYDIVFQICKKSTILKEIKKAE